MTCKSVRGYRICKAKKGKNNYSVGLTKPGRYGGTHILRRKHDLTLKQANGLVRRWTREVRHMKIKKRRTPYP